VKKEHVDLGKEVTENYKRIRKKKLIEIENILSRFKNDCINKGVTTLLAIATSAVRNARNKEDLVSLARDYGISLEEEIFNFSFRH
jgi:exopolyphosphatase/pppGpp-phosphohydrolase